MKNFVLKIVAVFLLVNLSAPLLAKHPHHGNKHHVGEKGMHIRMPKFDKKTLMAEDSINEQSKIGGVRFAQKFYVNFNPDNSGEITYDDSGRAIWKVEIQSDSAYSINLLFSKFHLLAGDTVYIYNSDKSKIVGPLTEHNNLKSGKLPTVPIEGDGITVELSQSADSSSLRSIEIGEVNHDYRGLRGLPQLIGATADSCSFHATCYDATDKIEKSVCLLIINGNELCTGTLVNNTAQDGKPYVLTAAHCLDDFSETPEQVASSIVAFFNYEVPNCMPSVRGSIEQSITGSTLKAFSDSIDLALVELSSMPPVDYRPYYAGWNLSTSPTPPFYGIHHPWGTVKRVAIENNTLVTVSYPHPSILSNSHWRVLQWDYGTTDNGSSGSGLFDSSGKLVGALTGGASVCTNPVKDDYYRLNKGWAHYSLPSKQLKAWLDPIDLGVTQLDGFNPYGEDTTLRISNIAKTEVPEKGYIQLPDSGLLSGQNSLMGMEYAEKFSLNENAYLYGVYIMPPVANADANRTSPNKITIRVYASDSVPDNTYLLEEKTIDLKTIQWSSYTSSFYTSNKAELAGNENYIRFDSPIAVGKKFFISYDVPYTNLPTDSFSVFTAPGRLSGGLETAMVYSGSSWQSMYDFAGIRTSLWIDPVIMYDSTAIALDTSLVDRSKKTVVYPNPATDHIFIMTRNDMHGECKITMYDFLGHVVKKIEGRVLYYSIEMDLSDVSSGVYFLRVEYENKSETHKIIINR